MIEYNPFTSVLENRSLSGKSATPSSRALVSANAIPTVFVFAFAGKPDAPAEEAILIDITIGADVMSELEKSKSSTACKLPGEA